MFLVMLSVTGFNFKRTILQCSIFTSIFCITINLSIVSCFRLKYFVLASSNWKLLNQHQESSVTVLGQKHSMISPSMWSDIYIILRILLPSGHNSTSSFIGWYSLFLSLLHYDVILNLKKNTICVITYWYIEDISLYLLPWDLLHFLIPL